MAWHAGEVSRADRYHMLVQKGATLWFTGLSGSGKSTVAVALEHELILRDWIPSCAGMTTFSMLRN